MDEDKQQAHYRDKDESNTQQRAALLGLEYLDTRGIASTIELVPQLMGVDDMKKSRLVPLYNGNDIDPFIFGITNNTPQSATAALKARYNEKGQTAKMVLISNIGYREMMLRYDPPKKVVYEDVTIAQEGDSNTIVEVSKTLESVSTDDILDYLITQAELLGASDIHLENERDELRVRFRVDGALHPVATISHDKYRVLLASIASRANVSTAATDAQSGSMQQKIEKEGKTQFLNMRIEVIPTVYGQDAVIRLFNFDESLLNLDKIGVSESERHQIDKIVKHPRGMVLMVGPTGSGKSTTLYSIINALNSTDRKIITLEDPVEFRVPGISQIPVNTDGGLSFADKLRAVLRLDPDVIMVGEIRDRDTARTAVQASITGHLVLSTFHANSAAAAFSRMVDMIGVNPIFSTAIRLVVGQRLVRKLDDNTKQPYKADQQTKDWIKDVLKDLPSHVQKPNLDDEVTLYKPGISEDSPFGYKGRIIVMEQMVVDEEIQKYLRGELIDVHTESIEKSAKKQGMVTMLQTGVLKALNGETTLEEINRVV